MKNYELLILFDPNASQEKQDSFKIKLEEILKEVSGDLFTYDKWGKHILAYPIKKHTYGIYCLARFKIARESNQVLKLIDQYIMIRCNDFIMRHMFTFLDGIISSDYRRPDSLENAPRREKNYTPQGYFNYEKTQMTESISSFASHSKEQSVDFDLEEIA